MGLHSLGIWSFSKQDDGAFIQQGKKPLGRPPPPPPHQTSPGPTDHSTSSWLGPEPVGCPSERNSCIPQLLSTHCTWEGLALLPQPFLPEECWLDPAQFADGPSRGGPACVSFPPHHGSKRRGPDPAREDSEKARVRGGSWRCPGIHPISPAPPASLPCRPGQLTFWQRLRQPVVSSSQLRLAAQRGPGAACHPDPAHPQGFFLEKQHF